MSRMATMPSAKPTWASAGVATQSPAAHTPGSPVRMFSSTTTKPRSSTVTAVPSRPSSAVAGLRPTDTTTTSALIGSAPSTSTTVPFSPGSWPTTLTPVRTSMPRFLKDRSTTEVTSLSQPGRILGSTSRIVTCVPRSLIIDANSQPMAPPPMTTAVPGTSGMDRTSSEVITIVPSTSKPGMVRTSDPAAGVDADPVAGMQAAVAVVDGDLAPLQQLGHAAHQLVHHRLLALQRGRPVDLRLADVDAEGRRL